MTQRPVGSGWGVQAWLSYDMSTTRSGNWTKSGATVTITAASPHGLQTGYGIYLTFAGVDAPPSDYYIVTGTPTASSFTVTASSGAGVSGTFTSKLIVQDSFNISKVIRVGTGVVRVLFLKPFANAFYSVATTAISRNPGVTPSNHSIVVLREAPLTTEATLVSTTSSNSEVDLSYVSAQFCGRQ